MKKSIGIAFDAKVLSEVKENLDEEKQRYAKIVRHFILNEYQLPDDFSLISNDKPEELIKEPIRLEEEVIEVLDDFINKIKNAGYKANRSNVMRHIYKELLAYLKANPSLKERKVLHNNFYFEDGTKRILDKLIPFRDRIITLERFILNEYKPTKDINKLKEKPKNIETIRVMMDESVFEKLDEYVEDLSESKISRTAFMRDAVYQLIEKLSNRSFQELLLEQQFDTVMYEYGQVFGDEKVKEKVKEYLMEKG